MNDVQHEFSRYASQYGDHNVIQRQVARKLVERCYGTSSKILDLGCGNGTLFSFIDWEIEHFTGVDFSQEMLSRHPKGKNVDLICGNFNDLSLFDRFSAGMFDRIFSASALQWAEDLDRVLDGLSRMNTPVSLAIFTSGTFKTLHDTAGVQPILRPADEVSEIAKRYFKAEFETVKYKLEFDNVRDMLRYIKRSGVSGKQRLLSVAQTKALMCDYPLSYLEFEVLFITQC